MSSHCISIYNLLPTQKWQIKHINDIPSSHLQVCAIYRSIFFDKQCENDMY